MWKLEEKRRHGCKSWLEVEIEHLDDLVSLWITYAMHEACALRISGSWMNTFLIGYETHGISEKGLAHLERACGHFPHNLGSLCEHPNHC